ncbi:MAG: C69 family dipeptidase, partial [Candidatus Hodarchaeota archaeon]
PPALLGMDLLRLALERGSTAIQAVHIICELLEKHGQGGPCAENAPNFTYHNSFLIADPTEAWVLETAGQWWIAHQITDGFRNISNHLSIRSEYSIARDGLVDYAIDKGYCEDSHDFDFAKCFSTGFFQESTLYSREGWSRYLLQTHDGKICPHIMMKILRDHKGGICMHGGFRTTASQVSHVLKKQSIHWFTGSPNPCVSFFKPFVVLPLENHKTIDIWDQRNQFDPVINRNGVQELNALEIEMIQKIQEWVKTGEWSTSEIQALTREALEKEHSLISL